MHQINLINVRQWEGGGSLVLMLLTYRVPNLGSPNHDTLQNTKPYQTLSRYNQTKLYCAITSIYIYELAAYDSTPIQTKMSKRLVCTRLLFLLNKSGFQCALHKHVCWVYWSREGELGRVLILDSRHVGH